MDDIVFIGSPHEIPLFEEAGFLCFEPAPGRMVERVLAERRRSRLMAMTQDTFGALPSWLTHDLLVWTPNQVFVIHELPRSSADVRKILSEILGKAGRARGSVA